MSLSDKIPHILTGQLPKRADLSDKHLGELVSAIGTVTVNHWLDPNGPVEFDRIAMAACSAKARVVIRTNPYWTDKDVAPFEVDQWDSRLFDHLSRYCEQLRRLRDAFGDYGLEIALVFHNHEPQWFVGNGYDDDMTMKVELIHKATNDALPGVQQCFYNRGRRTYENGPAFPKIPAGAKVGPWRGMSAYQWSSARNVQSWNATSDIDAELLFTVPTFACFSLDGCWSLRGRRWVKFPSAWPQACERATLHAKFFAECGDLCPFVALYNPAAQELWWNDDRIPVVTELLDAYEKGLQP